MIYVKHCEQIFDKALYKSSLLLLDFAVLFKGLYIYNTVSYSEVNRNGSKLSNMWPVRHKKWEQFLQWIKMGNQSQHATR